MKPPHRSRQIGEQRRCPFLQTIAVELETALAPGDRDAGSDQRVRPPLRGWDEAVRVTLAQPESGEDDLPRSGRRDQLA